MSKVDKLRRRFLNVPADLTWNELVTVLRGFDYIEDTSAGGSYRSFLCDMHSGKIILHKPHPGSIVPQYAIRKIIKTLEEYGLI